MNLQAKPSLRTPHGVAGSAPGYLSKPDGMDLTTPAIAQRLRAGTAHG